MLSAESMARLHARAFQDTGQIWSAPEISDLLKSAFVFAVGDAQSFALGRVIADEAELLTLATDPEHQGRGLGRATLAAYERQAFTLGAKTSFLEVAQDNDTAISLYRSAGYAQSGHRPGYYHRQDQPRVDALIFSKRLT